MKKVGSMLAGLLCVSILLAGCGSPKDESSQDANASTPAQSSSGADEPSKPEKAVLRFMAPYTSPTDGVQTDDVSRQIEEDTGITLSLYANQDEATVNAMLASKDMPDLWCLQGIGAESSTSVLKRFIENDRVLAMEELMEQYGPNVLLQDKMLQFCRDNYSNGSGKVYALLGYIDPPAEKAYDATKGLTLRFDYYEELGCPKIESADDWLNVVNQMLEAHPTTDSGEKRYGFSTFFEWGWGLIAEYGDIVNALEGIGTVSTTATTMQMMLKDGTVEDKISNLDSSTWKGAHLFFQANQMGILDPDIYINKWDTMSAKGDRVLTSQFDWHYAEFNTLNADKGQGYAVIPMKAREYVIAAATPLGGAHRMFIIPSEGKEPEAAMRFLDYMYSCEGARKIFCGVEGRDFVEKDGKLMVPASVTQAKKEDPNWSNTVGANKYVPGLGPSYIDPKFGQPLGLTRPEDMEEQPGLNPFQKLYCDHYGINSMREAYVEHLDVWTTDGTVTALLEATPDDIAEIDAQINKYLGVEIPNIITVSDQAAFEAKQQEIIEECKKLGLDQSVAFWKENYANATEKAAKYK